MFTTHSTQSIPWELFGWFATLALALIGIFLLISWQPGYEYTPRPKKKPPDKWQLLNWIRDQLHNFGISIQNYIYQLPSKCRQ
jgi:hypothetical protein